METSRQILKRFRKRALGYSLLMALSVTLLFVTYEHRNTTRDIRATRHQVEREIRQSMEREQQQLVEFYNARIKGIVSWTAVGQAMQQRDHDRLLELTARRFNVLREEQPFLANMHFHAPDGTSLLRVHKPDVYGDNIGQHRPLISTVNRTLEPAAGFDEGYYGLYFRIIRPAYSANGKHIGSLEVGILPEYFVKAARRMHPGLHIAIVVPKDRIQMYRQRDQLAQRGPFYIMSPDDPLFHRLLENPAELQGTAHTMQIDNRDYLFIPGISIPDYQGRNVLQMYLLKDISDIQQQFESRLIEIAIMGLLLFGATVVIIGFSLTYFSRQVTRLQRQLRQYIGIVDRNVIIAHTDLEGRLTQVSDAFEQASGYKRDEIIGQSYQLIHHPGTPSDTYRSLWKAVRDGQTWQGEFCNCRKDGSLYWVQSRVSAWHDEQGKQVGYTAIEQDISDRKRIEQLSVTDPLTGCYNRLKIDEVLNYECVRTRRSRRGLALIMIDIDDFKQINDRHGHQTGDQVLREFAQILQSRLRKTDTLGRWGGEEFIVICPETNCEGASHLAEILRQAVEEHRFADSLRITCSFGLSCCLGPDDDRELLINRADTALYQAKASGRNQVRICNWQE